MTIEEGLTHSLNRCLMLTQVLLIMSCVIRLFLDALRSINSGHTWGSPEPAAEVLLTNLQIFNPLPSPAQPLQRHKISKIFWAPFNWKQLSRVLGFKESQLFGWTLSIGQWGGIYRYYWMQKSDGQVLKIIFSIIDPKIGSGATLKFFMIKTPQLLSK